MFEHARGLGLEGDALADELLRLTAVYNYIPEDMAPEYREVVLKAYLDSLKARS